MKVLIVGGMAQGKRARAEAAYGWAELLDGAAVAVDDPLEANGLDQLHLYVRRLLDAGVEPVGQVLAQLDALDSWVVLCDEVGCGVVPLDRRDRDWREAVGRICCTLAERADIVERVHCGLAQRLKGYLH